MTVCIATSNYLPDEGGITTFNLHLSALLHHAAHKVIILTVEHHSNENEEDELTENTNGICVVKLKKSYYTKLKKNSPYFKPGSFNAPGWIAMGYAMRDWLIKNQVKFGIDIIESSDYGGIAAFLMKKGLPPVVISNHGSLTQIVKYNYARKDDHLKVLKKLELISFKNAAAVIIHSPVHLQEFVQFTAIPVCLATIPFDIKKFRREETPGKNYAVAVGGLQTIKGVFVLAAALKKSKSAVPVKWVGGDSYSAQSRMPVADKLAIDYPGIWNQTFQWTGIISNSETIALIKDSQFVIIPSLWETFNYVAIEAAASGKAIIITQETGAAYLFTHEQDALVIPAADDQSLAEAIMTLSNDKMLCEKLGKNAREMVTQVFNPERIVGERISIYEKVILNKQKVRDANHSLLFLENYFTFYRKLYFRIFSFIKVFYKKINGQ